MKNTGKNGAKGRFALLASSLVILLILAGCSPSPAPSQSPEESPTEPSSPQAADAACTTKECFIASANECKETDMTLTEKAGVFRYSTSADCIFTKTLISLSADETQEMKTLLEGRSLTCRYERGRFDSRWVTSLIFGTEYCEGELRNILTDLIAFV